MADEYGEIHFENNCSGDPEVIMDALNRYLWNTDQKPFMRTGGKIQIDGFVQYPTVHPDKKIFVDDDENAIDTNAPGFKGVIDPTWNCEAGEEVELGDLVKSIAPLLGDGEITISVSRSLRDTLRMMGSLTIKSDMTATRHLMSVASSGRHTHQTDSFP
jgi:hypothetical protein